MGHLRTALMAIAVATGTGCSDTGGPDPQGPPYFRATISGTPWAPQFTSAGCGEYSLMLRAVPITSPISGADLLEVRIGNVTGTGACALTDSASGRFPQKLAAPGPNATYRSTTQQPGRFTITPFDLADSIVAGSFAVRLTSVAFPPVYATMSGIFRLPLVSI